MARGDTEVGAMGADAVEGSAPTTATVGAGPEARSRRDLLTVSGAVAAGFLLLELLRVWLPSIVVVLGELEGAGPATLGLVALGALGLAPLVATLLGPLQPRLVWLLGAGVLLGSRLALLLVDGGRPQLTVTTVGVAGGALALVGLAGGGVRGDLARLGTFAGAALSSALHATLGSVDLAWHGGAVGALGTLTVIVLAGPPLLRATRALDAGPAAAAWPWGTLGPALLLLGALAAPAGRIATASGWGPGLVGVSAVAIMLLAVLGGVLAASTGPLLAGTAGAALVVAGTAGALDAQGVGAVAAQAALAAGLGLAVVAGSRGGRTTPRRRGVVVGASLLLLGALTFAAYAGALVTLPFGTHAVLLTAALLVAVGVLVSTVRGARLGREPASPLLPRLTTTAVLVALVLAGPAALRSAGEAGPPPADGTLRVVLANVHYGFDVEGRQRALDTGELLAGLDADLIALNEVDRGWLVSGAPDLLASFATATGLTPVFGPAADEVWGNALLTRLPVLEVQVTPLPQGRDPLGRSALTVVVERPDGSPLGVVVTHLSNIDRQGETRLPQAQAVAAAVARLTERGIPAIVAGDLNATPDDPAFAVLTSIGLRGALAPGRRTFPDAAPRLQLDHVLLPDGLEVVQADALATGLSDHRFVTVETRPVAPTSEEGEGDGGSGDGASG